VAEYIPRKGDFITATFAHRAGHEQSGRRPALVVSNDLFNRHTGLAMVCPVTSTRRGYPFHVEIPAGRKVNGFVMVEQLRSIDFRARQAKRLAKAPDAVVDEALSLLDACLY
jgi:mRNA interferase MazF